jgi:hypothetical protein
MVSGRVGILHPYNDILRNVVIDHAALSNDGVDRAVVALNIAQQDAAMLGSKIAHKAVFAAVLALPFIAHPAVAHAQSKELVSEYIANQKFYGRVMQDPDARQELKNSLDTMFDTLKNKYGVVPDEVKAPRLRELVGNARTYAEFAGTIYGVMTHDQKLYANGEMSPKEIQEFVALQQEVIAWNVFFLRFNVEFDPLWNQGKLENVGNLFNVFVGNPGLKGNPRTDVCSTATVMLMASLIAEGFPKNSVSAVAVDFNYGDKDDTGKHAALLVKIKGKVDGMTGEKGIIEDLTEGHPHDAANGLFVNWGFVQNGTPHHVIETLVNGTDKRKVIVVADPELKYVRFGPVSSLDKESGEFFDNIIMNEVGRSELADGIRFRDVMDKRLVDANNLFINLKRNEPASEAYKDIIREIDERIQSLQGMKKDQFNDFVGGILMDGKPLRISQVIGQLKEQRNDALMGEENAVLARGMDALNNVNALFNQKDYKGAYHTGAELMLYIDSKVQSLTDSGLGKTGSTWKDDQGHPIDGYALIDQLKKQHNEAEKMKANANIGEAIAFIDRITADISAVNKEDYREAAKSYAAIMSMIDSEIAFRKDAGLDKISEEMSLWNTGKKNLGGAEVLGQLIDKQKEVKELFDQNALKVLKTKGLKVGNPRGDKAMQSGPENLDKYGGIDLNAANLKLLIKRDGKGFPLPVNMQDMEQLRNIQGFAPEIIEIRPAVNLPVFSELQQKFQSAPFGAILEK